jgi:hypothetical protein
MASIPMNQQESSKHLAASRLTGADIQFLHLVQLLSSRLTGQESVSSPEARARIASLQEQFQRVYASIFAKHLTEQQASGCLAALESAPVQRFLAARQLLRPALKQRLATLEQRMGNLEI